MVNERVILRSSGDHMHWEKYNHVLFANDRTASADEVQYNTAECLSCQDCTSPKYANETIEQIPAPII